MSTNQRFIKNFETVKKIGEIFGFKVHSFDPEWTIFYDIYGIDDGCCDIPDKFMEQIAKMMALPWENRYKSYLTTVTLDKALIQRAREDRAYQAVCFASQLILSIRSESAIWNLLRL